MKNLSANLKVYDLCRSQQRQTTLDQFYNRQMQNINNNNYFLSNMNALSLVRPKGRRYTLRFIMICQTIFLTSFSCYCLLRKLGLPLISPSRLYSLLNPSISSNIIQLLHLKQASYLIQSYRKTNRIDNETLEIVVAVDAISFHPKIKINKKGEVIGIDGEMCISEENQNELEKQFKAFEEYVNKIKNVTLIYAFIYQIQPLRKDFRDVNRDENFVPGLKKQPRKKLALCVHTF